VASTNSGGFISCHLTFWSINLALKVLLLIASQSWGGGVGMILHLHQDDALPSPFYCYGEEAWFLKFMAFLVDHNIVKSFVLQVTGYPINNFCQTEIYSNAHLNSLSWHWGQVKCFNRELSISNSISEVWNWLTTGKNNSAYISEQESSSTLSHKWYLFSCFNLTSFIRTRYLDFGTNFD
jgi:hypothetical protein